MIYIKVLEKQEQVKSKSSRQQNNNNNNIKIRIRTVINEIKTKKEIYTINQRAGSLRN